MGGEIIKQVCETLRDDLNRFFFFFGGLTESKHQKCSSVIAQEIFVYVNNMVS